MAEVGLIFQKRHIKGKRKKREYQTYKYMLSCHVEEVNRPRGNKIQLTRFCSLKLYCTISQENGLLEIQHITYHLHFYLYLESYSTYHLFPRKFISLLDAYVCHENKQMPHTSSNHTHTINLVYVLKLDTKTEKVPITKVPLTNGNWYMFPFITYFLNSFNRPLVKLLSQADHHRS